MNAALSTLARQAFLAPGLTYEGWNSLLGTSLTEADFERLHSTLGCLARVHGNPPSYWVYPWTARALNAASFVKHVESIGGRLCPELDAAFTLYILGTI